MIATDRRIPAQLKDLPEAKADPTPKLLILRKLLAGFTVEELTALKATHLSDKIQALYRELEHKVEWKAGE